MGVAYNPQIVTDGLVSTFDATNLNSFPDTTPIKEHGYAEWYCFENGTVTYSIVDAGVSIIEKQSNGTLTTVVSTSSGPTRGTFAATAGRTYYGSGGPIFLVVEDQHHRISPLTMAGTQFIWWIVRESPGTIYCYSPFKDATIKFWHLPTSGGITNTTQTNIQTLNAGSQTTQTITKTLSNSDYEIVFITSTEPILVSAACSNNADRTILSPASKYVYQRFSANNSNVIQLAPSSSQTGAVHHPTHSVMAQNIADGNGYDSEQGLGLEFLSDRYSWGNTLSDYTISAPYNGTITTSYWDGSAWQVWDTHTISAATLESPSVIQRNGNSGPGVWGGDISGSSADMVSGTTTLWKWEGTVPFYLCINDSVADELTLRGWMASRLQTRNTNQYLQDIINPDNKLAVHGSLIHTGVGIETGSGIGRTVTNGYYKFPNDQVTNYLMDTSYPMPTRDHTISCWFRSNFTSTNQTPYTYSINGDNTWLCFTDSSVSIVPHSFGDRYPVTVPSMLNKWCNFTRTRVATNGLEVYYMNGAQVGSRIVQANRTAGANGFLIVGQEADTAPTGNNNGSFATNQNLDGDFARLDVYDRALNISEVKQNFNAARPRFDQDFGAEVLPIVSNGLVFHVDASDPISNSGISTTAWYDISGYENHLYWSGSVAPEFANFSNNAVLNTSNVSTSLRPIISNTYNGMRIGQTAYTAFAIFKPNSTTSRKILMSFGPANSNCSGQNVHPIVINNNGKFGGGACGGLGTWSDATGVTPTTSRFWCVATTYDGTTERVYVDGVLDKTAAMTTNTPVSSSNAIGYGWIRDDGATYSMAASIGTMMLYNRALSSFEVEQNFNALRGRFGI